MLFVSLPLLIIVMSLTPGHPLLIPQEQV